MNLKARWRLLKIAFELHDQGTSCCRMLMCPGEGSAGNRCRACPGEGSAGNRCRACPGEGSTGSRQQATRRGWHQARPRALVRVPGAQERPVWAVDSVESAPGAGVWRWARKRRYIPLFQFSAAEREREREKCRVLKGGFTNMEARVQGGFSWVNHRVGYSF
ncbi:hypothetical protein QL285_014892 [Trifolium repens]|nr:hypothetical protein QL285_014892 [Trifolium repens]